MLKPKQVEQQQKHETNMGETKENKKTIKKYNYKILFCFNFKFGLPL